MKPHEFYVKCAVEHGAESVSVSCSPQSNLVVLHVKGLDVQAREELMLEILRRDDTPQIAVQVLEVSW